MLLILLAAYSVALSTYLVGLKWFQRKTDDELQTIWKHITAKADPSVEEIKAIAEIAKARQTEIPWHERSISTIGIVAFFSMLVATSFQTINSAKTAVESSNLKQEIQSLEAQRDSWNRLVRDLSEVIVLKATNGKLEQSEEAILKQRLSDLDKTDKPDKDTQAEQLKIYLALKQYDNASGLIEKSKLLGDDASPETLLFLAEIAFVDGARARARALLKKFQNELSNQPADWQFRFYVLSAALDPDPKIYIERVASLRHLSLEDANQLLEAKVDELKTQARRRGNSVEKPPSN